MLVLPFSGFSQKQYFTLIPNAFVAAGDTTSNFIIVQYPSKTASELYKAILSIVPSAIQASRYTLNSVENQTISIRWNADGEVPLKTGLLDSRKSAFFSPTIVLHIKDGKIKIDAPEAVPLKCTDYGNGQGFSLYLDKYLERNAFDRYMHMFNSDGTIYSKTLQVKQAIESELNSIVEKILVNVEKQLENDW